MFTTVDGSFGNPANQLRLVVYPVIYDRFQHHPRWLFGISEPSTVSLKIVTFFWGEGFDAHLYMSYMFFEVANVNCFFG